MIIQDNVINDDEKIFIEKNIIKSNSFPLYYSKATRDKFPFFEHVLVTREGKVNSSVYEIFKNIFLRFAFDNDITVNEITRACINISYEKNNYKFTDPHVDNQFQHKVFILYLNDLTQDELSSCTLIFNERFSEYQIDIVNVDVNDISEMTIKEKVHAKFGRAICFDGDYYHSACFPSASELRYVVVFNFT